MTWRNLAPAVALAAVLVYRVVNFWLIIAVGWLLMLRPGARRAPPVEPDRG